MIKSKDGLASNGKYTPSSNFFNGNLASEEDIDADIGLNMQQNREITNKGIKNVPVDEKDIDLEIDQRLKAV